MRPRDGERSWEKLGFDEVRLPVDLNGCISVAHKKVTPKPRM